MGLSKKAVSTAFPRNSLHHKPSAAVVPSIVAKLAAAEPIKKLFQIAWDHFGEETSSTYHFVLVPRIGYARN